jgi:hypothetical protein
MKLTVPIMRAAKPSTMLNAPIIVSMTVAKLIQPDHTFVRWVIR